MKKFLAIFIISFSLGLLLISFITYASQTTMSTYYPSPSGSYTKVHLVNQSGGPNENSSTSAFCQQTSSGYSSPGSAGATFINAGAIFADPTSGYLEICKSDGSVASYPGASFNRFCSGAGCATCPPKYTVVPNSSTPFTGVTSYSCAFTNSGTTSTAKSGCFSIFSSGTTTPASCFSVDHNAYDMGCQTITLANSCSAVRTCCFNTTASGLALNTSSSCQMSVVNGTCTAWGACSQSACGVSGTETCTASTAPQCGGSSAVGTTQSCTGDTPVNGTCTAWGACSSTCSNTAGTKSCTASTAPQCGGSSAVGTTTSCTGTGSVVNGTCTAWGTCSSTCSNTAGTKSCTASTAPQCGGSSAVGTTTSCTGTGSVVNGTCTAWGACNVACGSGTQSCANSTPAQCGGTAPPASQSCTGGTTCSSPDVCTSGECTCPNTCTGYSCGTDPCGHVCGSGTCSGALVCFTGATIDGTSATPGTTPGTCTSTNCGGLLLYHTGSGTGECCNMPTCGSCTGTNYGATYDCANGCYTTSTCTGPSCGGLLAYDNYSNVGAGCCTYGCAGASAGPTSDCNQCCASTSGVNACMAYPTSTYTVAATPTTTDATLTNVSSGTFCATSPAGAIITGASESCAGTPGTQCTASFNVSVDNGGSASITFTQDTCGSLGGGVCCPYACGNGSYIGSTYDCTTYCCTGTTCEL